MRGIKAFIFSMTIFLASWSWAGYEVVNGGDALVCASKVTILDIGEVALQNPILYPDVLDPFQRAEKVLSSWSSKDKYRAQRWLQELEYLKSHIRWTKENEVLSNVPDEGAVVLPRGCYLLQAAFQSRDPLTDTYVYNFDTVIWNDLDLDAQTALIVHEVIYKDLLGDRPSAQSHLIRPFVRLILTTLPQELRFSEYIETLKKIGYRYYNFKQWRLSLLAPFKIEGLEIVQGEVFDLWEKNCGWQWVYSVEKKELNLTPRRACSKSAILKDFNLGRFYFKAGVSKIKYVADRLSLALASDSVVFSLYDREGSVLALNSEVVQSFMFSIEKSEAVVVVFAKQNTTCDQILLGSWQKYAKCRVYPYGSSSRRFILGISK